MLRLTVNKESDELSENLSTMAVDTNVWLLFNSPIWQTLNRKYCRNIRKKPSHITDSNRVKIAQTWIPRCHLLWSTFVSYFFHFLLCLHSPGGLFYFWGLNIETVTATCMTLAIGLCIDYAAHIGSTFMSVQGWTRGKKSYNCFIETRRGILSLTDTRAKLWFTY